MKKIKIVIISQRVIFSVCFLLILSGCTKSEQTVERKAGENGQTGHSIHSHSEIKTAHREILKPVVAGQVDFRANLVIMPDGSWEVYTARDTEGIYRLEFVRSTDNGRSWSEPQVLRELPGKDWAGAVSLLDSDSEVHLFFMRWRQKEGRKPAVDRFIDLWHLRSEAQRTHWTGPQRIFKGYVGSIQNAIQLESGRIVLPFAAWISGRATAPPYGSNVTTTVFSDDGGLTWNQAEAELTSPCYHGYNGNNYGAVEPVILELRDGRVLMLVRTQTGFLWESWSTDGEHWSELMPSRFHSSTSPAYLLRLPDDRIALFWNNCDMPPRVDGQGVYGGRDVMHAAISCDEGKTWHGYREVYLDPVRNESPPKRGDRGTAYPFAVMTKNSGIALVTGQGQGRRGLILIDPEWIMETHHEDDFSGGLHNWSVFKSFGPAQGWWRDRTQGALLIDHPNKPGAHCLHIRRPDEKQGDGAVWNFPSGRSGRIAMNIMLRKGSGGVTIALADRFFNPTDINGEKKALYLLEIAAGGVLPAGTILQPGKFHTLVLVWDTHRRHCDVLVDGVTVCGLPLLNETVSGASYLRFRSTAQAVDMAGILVEKVTKWQSDRVTE